MRYSIFVSMVVFCLMAASCGSSIRSGCGQAETLQLSRTDIPVVIEASDSLQSFDMEMSFLGKHLNGILLVKKQGDETVRMIINSYFGMSMADFEIRADTFIVHYLFDAMQKPALVNLFKNDFRLLLGYTLPEHFTARQSVCSDSKKWISVETGNGKFQYRFDSKNEMITQIKAPGVHVDIPINTHPRTITLKHKGIFSPTIVIKELE